MPRLLLALLILFSLRPAALAAGAEAELRDACAAVVAAAVAEAVRTSSSLEVLSIRERSGARATEHGTGGPVGAGRGFALLAEFASHEAGLHSRRSFRRPQQDHLPYFANAPPSAP